MPLKHNMTKHDVLATKIRKLSLKGGVAELGDEDKKLFITAVMVASFSSGLSWQTHNALMGEISKLNSPEVKEEYRNSLLSKWKNISAADISEVISKGVSDAAFATWMYFNVDKREHGLYKATWEGLQREFLDACDDMEIVKESK